jgi:hypothetical protein
MIHMLNLILFMIHMLNLTLFMIHMLNIIIPVRPYLGVGASRKAALVVTIGRSGWWVVGGGWWVVGGGLHPRPRH